ncbi:MAG: exo-alpha-sialidase [Siphonobacter sp.]
MALSSKYANLSLRNPLTFGKHLFSFCRDIYYTGKTVELFSFIGWEIMHRGKLFPARKYLNFSDHKAYSIETLKPARSTTHTIEETNYDWKFCIITPSFEHWCVPMEHHTKLYLYVAGKLQLVHTFHTEIKSLFITKSGTILVAAGGCIYRGTQETPVFKKVLQLSSTISWFLFNNGITELPNGDLFLGEYGSLWQTTRWKSLAYYYRSQDNGYTWQKIPSLYERGVNKHVHVLKYSSLLNSLIMTDGDNHKKIWINESLSAYEKLNRFKRNNGWKMVNHFHWMKGGYTSMIDGQDRLFLGSDYMGGTNFLVSTKDGKQYLSEIIPDPYRQSPIMNMTYLKTPTHTEIWASLYCSIGGKVKCLIMYTRNDGKTWNKFLEYDGSQYAVHLISHSDAPIAHLYLSVTGTGTYKVYKISSSQSLN